MWHREAGRSREECVRSRQLLSHRIFVGIHEEHAMPLSVARSPPRYLLRLVLLCLASVYLEKIAVVLKFHL